MTLEMREYHVAVHGRFTDLRGAPESAPYLAPDDYRASQLFAREQRQHHALGIVYPSVRNPGGECIAAFRTLALSPAVQCGHLGYVWNGRAITEVIALSHSGITPRD